MLSLIKLENRIVLDGAAVAAAIDHHLSQHDTEAETEMNTSGYIHEYTHIAGAAALLADPAAPESADVVLIDNTLPDYQVLADAASPDAHVILYNGATETAADVIAKVTALSQELNTPIDTVSILSHGGDGKFNLGNETISAETVSQNADVWASLNAVMDDDASIFIFGCGVSGDSGNGQTLLNSLSHATGAKVFASDDTTGRGGDWVLEASSEGASADDIAPPLNVEILASYSEILNADKPVFPSTLFEAHYREDVEDNDFSFKIIDPLKSPSANLKGTVISQNPALISNSNLSIEQVSYLGDGNSFWTVKFKPEADKVGIAKIAITINNGTAESTHYVDIHIKDVNDAPILHTINYLPGFDPEKFNPLNPNFDLKDFKPENHMRLNSIIEDIPIGNNNGTTVQDIINSSKANNGNAITDVDENPKEGIAIVATNARCKDQATGDIVTIGEWQYSTDNGATWKPIENVSKTEALVLDATNKVRFVQNREHWNGTIPNGLTIVAWDQTGEGKPGDKVNSVKPAGTPPPPRDTTAFSSAQELVSITVVPDNDSPDLNPADVKLFDGIKEDPDPDAGPRSTPQPNLNEGTKVGKIIENAVTDPDDRDPCEVVLSNTVVRALSANANGNDAFPMGIAVIGANTENGHWEYKLNGGTSWLTLGNVSEQNATLLDSDALIRFVPNDNYNLSSFKLTDQDISVLKDLKDSDNKVIVPENVIAQLRTLQDRELKNEDSFNFEQKLEETIGKEAADKFKYLIMNTMVKDSIQFRAWDMSDGKASGATGVQIPAAVGGSSAYSEAIGKSSITVKPMNDAPVLNTDGGFKLTVDENTGIPLPEGNTVAQIVGGRITDIDNDALGIVITNVVTQNGTWQYKLENGAWTNLPSGLSPTNGMALGMNDSLRFTPASIEAGGWFGESKIEFNALDKSMGNSPGDVGINVTVPRTGIPTAIVPNRDTTAFSLADGTITLGNQAPVAVPDSYDMNIKGTLTVSAQDGVLANDYDPDGDPIRVVTGSPAILLEQPKYGTVALNADGSFTYTHTPGAGAVLPDSFVYQVTDGKAVSSATVTLGVPNRPPVADSDEYNVPQGSTVNGQLTGSDPDGDNITFVKVTDTASGRVVINPDGTFVYIPSTPGVKEDSFTFKVIDFPAEAESGVADIKIKYYDVHPHIAPPEGYQPYGPGIIPLIRPYAENPGGDLAKEKFFPGQIGETPGPGVRAFRADMWGGREIPPRDFCSLEEALREHLGCRFASTKNPESKFDAVHWDDLGWEKPYLDEEYDLYTALFLREKDDKGFSVETGSLTRSFGMDEEQAFAKENRNEEYDVYSDLFLELAPNASLNKVKAGEMKKDFFRDREHLDVTGRGLL